MHQQRGPPVQVNRHPWTTLMYGTDVDHAARGSREMAASNPSWGLSRYVRATIIGNDLPIAEDTATVERIEEIASNLAGNG